MNTLLLSTHIAGAVVVGVFLCMGALAVIRGRREYFSFYIKSIAWGGAFELASGSLLALMSTASVFSFCVRIGLYLVAIGVVEAMLFVSTKKEGIASGMRDAVLPLGAGVAVSSVALILLAI